MSKTTSHDVEPGATAAIHLLLVDDSPTDAKLVVRELRRTWAKLTFERVDSAEAMGAALQKGGIDAVLCDWSMPHFSAMRALEALNGTGLDIPFILVSGTIGEEAAADGMRAGAHDYVLKDRLARLTPALEREIRERKVREAERRSAEALRLVEARFRALIEESHDGLSLSRPDGSLSYLSPAGRRLLGIRGEENWRATIARWAPEDRAELAARRDWLAAHPGEVLRTEIRVPQPDGPPRWIESSARNLLHEPHIRAIVSNFRDVTAQRQMIEALRSSEHRFRALSESGIVGIAIADNAGGFVDANDAFLRMVGYSREDLTAGRMSWKAMTPPESAAGNATAVEQLRKRGFATPWEKEYLRKDGSRLPCFVGLSALDGTRNILLAIDLTERKRVEAALAASDSQLRQAQKMEAIGRLAGGVAHDFNNMLSVIISYATMMLETISTDDPMRDDASEIVKAGRRAADLTRQLLLFSRQQVVETRVLDLNAVLANMDKMLRRLVGEDVEVVFTRSPTLGRIRADPSSIEQVVMNLAVNARDAMPRGGRLTLATEDVVLDQAYVRTHHGATAGPHVMLCVSDTGTGMDEPTIARIFEPFFTTKGLGQGTGLGLSTVFGIVQQSGGTIWVESEPGRGSTFKVYLPRVEETADRQMPTVAPTTLRGSETVLLVEDEEQLRLVARGILKRAGYRVLEARNGGEAILICEQHPERIDLLLSDVVMPHLSGPDLAKRLGEARPEMRVLCMSGYTDEHVVRHGMIEGTFAFLQKPFTPESLRRKVREVLESAQ